MEGVECSFRGATRRPGCPPAPIGAPARSSAARSSAPAAPRRPDLVSVHCSQTRPSGAWLSSRPPWFGVHPTNSRRDVQENRVRFTPSVSPRSCLPPHAPRRARPLQRGEVAGRLSSGPAWHPPETCLLCGICAATGADDPQRTPRPSSLSACYVEELLGTVGVGFALSRSSKPRVASSIPATRTTGRQCVTSSPFLHRASVGCSRRSARVRFFHARLHEICTPCLVRGGAKDTA